MPIPVSLIAIYGQVSLARITVDAHDSHVLICRTRPRARQVPVKEVPAD